MIEGWGKNKGKIGGEKRGFEGGMGNGLGGERKKLKGFFAGRGVRGFNALA